MMGWRVVVLVAVWAGRAVATGSGPVPCPGVRFVSDVPIAGGSRRAIGVDVDGHVTIPGFCDATLARWKARRGGHPVLRAGWKACGATSRVRLRMEYGSAACTTATGLLRARRTSPVRFMAVASTCGDQYLDASEACELTTPCASAGVPCVDCQCGPAGSTTTTTTLGGGTTTTMSGRLFDAPNPWNTDISTLPAAPESSTIITALATAGGWGNTNNLQIDFSMHLLHVDGTTPFLTFTKSPGYYSPDCDEPFPFPLPIGGAIEGQAGYTCATGLQDCHLLVVDATAKRLYEMYQATLANGMLSAVCGLFWDLTQAYPPNLRGEQCTSTDAAGFPVGALLFTADEVAAGEIAHAIRFILPNARMRAGVYVHPASHAGAPSGGASLPPYGVRFRLRADFPLTPFSASAQVILRAMQKYGMLLADGGNIALTAASDRYTAHTWAELGIDSHVLFGVQVTDMEVVDLGATIPITYACVRNP